MVRHIWNRNGMAAVARGGAAVRESGGATDAMITLPRKVPFRGGWALFSPSSLPGLTRQSIPSREQSAHLMDARVEPAHDESVLERRSRDLWRTMTVRARPERCCDVVIARSEATKPSRVPSATLDRVAALAMTHGGNVPQATAPGLPR